MPNFDLYILYPIFIILGFASFFFIVSKEKLKGDRLFFCFKTTLYWMVTSFCGFEILKQSNLFPWGRFHESLLILMASVGTIFLSIILKPIYSILINKVFKNQKKLFYFVYFFEIIMIFLLFINPAVHTGHTTIIIFASVCYGICLAVSTTEFLFYNEQFFYKISPQAVTWIILTASFLGSFIGIYIFSLIYQSYDTKISPSNNYYIHAIMLLIIAFVIFLTNKIKEDPKLSGIYDEVFLSSLRPYKKSVGFFLILLSFLLGFIYGINSSVVVENLVLSFLAKGNNLSDATYNIVHRSFNIGFFASAAILGYPIYHFIIKKILFSYTILILIAIIAIDCSILIFARNGFLMLVLLFISNFVFSQLLYMLVSSALSWQYRTNFYALTGLVIAASLVGVYVFNLIIAILDVKSKTIYYNQNKFFSEYQLHGFSQDQYYSINLIGTTMLLIAVLIIMCWLILFHFTKKIIISEIDNFEKNRQLSKKLVQLSLIEKSKIPLVLDETNGLISNIEFSNIEDIDEEDDYKINSFLNYDTLKESKEKSDRIREQEIEEYLEDSDEF